MRRRIAEHDVWSAVHELADAVGHPGDRAHLECAAGNRHADRLRVTRGHLGGQVGDPCRRLGLAVHDVEVDAPLLAPFEPRRDAVGAKATTGLGQEAERRDVEEVWPGVVEQLVGVGHARHVGHPVAAQRSGEARVDDRCLDGHDAGPGEQVRVQDGEPVAVVQRQGRDAAVRRREAEVADDGSGVADEVVVRETHELRRARRSGRAEQQSEVGVQRSVSDAARPLDAQLGAVDVDDGVGCPRVGQPVGVLTDDQRDVRPLQQRQIGGHELDRRRRLHDDERAIRQRQLVQPAAHAGGQLVVRDNVVALDQRGRHRCAVAQQGGGHSILHVSHRHPGYCKACLSSDASLGPRLVSEGPRALRWHP